MNKRDLQEILMDQKEVFLSKRGLIQRDLSLEPFLRTSQVVVITGIFHPYRDVSVRTNLFL